MHGHLRAVADLFRERNFNFWKGQWSLTEVISLIPRPLWIDYVLISNYGIWKQIANLESGESSYRNAVRGHFPSVLLD